jgi:hypothetical protein
MPHTYESWLPYHPSEQFFQQKGNFLISKQRGKPHMARPKQQTAAEKRISIEEQIRQLDNKRKLLIQEEKEEARKARTHRICVRGGMIEGLLPDTIMLSDERFRTFIEKHVNNKFGRAMLVELVAEQVTEDATASQPTPTAEPPSGADESKTVIVEKIAS